MNSAVALFVALALVGAASATPAKTKFYRGHKVLSVTPKTAEELETLKGLESNDDLELDFWTDPVAVGKEVRSRKSGKYISLIQNQSVSTRDAVSVSGHQYGAWNTGIARGETNMRHL